MTYNTLLIKQSETSSDDVINDKYLIIYFTNCLNKETELYLETLETVTKSRWLSD